MRVYDTQHKVEGDGWAVEVTEYHDEHGSWVGPRRWHARVKIQDDSYAKVMNFNRTTQQELSQTLERVDTAFIKAQELVLTPTI